MATSEFPHHLCTSGVAGLIGGDEAVLALTTVQVYESRRWLGWYNVPGSYQISKRFGLLAKSGIPNDASPCIHTDLTKLLQAGKGPKFRATYSGTVIEETSHVASLVMKDCAGREGNTIGGRKTAVVGVMVVQLNHIPGTHMDVKHTDPYTPIRAGILIFLNFASLVVCVVFADWYAFAWILLGILANGISSVIIGSGKLQFIHPDPAPGCPAGDGILVAGGEIVLLKGKEGAVNSITRGNFSLQFSNEAEVGRIGWCSALFAMQFIVQLLLIPGASLIGQILFAVSMGVAWINNHWMASNNGKILRDILFNTVLEKPDVKKYTLGTFTSAVVFSLLVLRPKDPKKFLDELLPNNTNAWMQWKETITQRFKNEEPLSATGLDLNVLTEEEEKLLRKLYEDAEEAYNGYQSYSEYVKELEKKKFSDH